MQVARRKFTWKVGVWWGAGFLCEAAALAAGAMAAGSTAHLRLSATMLAAAACSFHVPVLGPNFKSLYRNYMVTWVALDAATQTLDRGTARTPAPHRRFNSSPNIPAAAEDASGQDALVNMGSSSSRPANVAFARNLGVVSPPAWGRSSSAAQREHAMAFFRVHLQLGLVAVATSVHAALLLAPAANVLLAASTATTSTSQKPDDETTLGVLLLGLVVAAWAVAVCVRWNVVYGVSACCVLLSLPVGHGLLSMLDADARGHPRGAFQPLWDDLSTSPALLSAFASIAVAALAAVAIAHYCVQQVCALLTQQGGERYGWGTLGSSGYWGSEALLEPLEGPGASAQGLQGAHAHRSFNSLEMSALLHHDDSGLDPP